jgi:hypothetical protein
MSTILVVGVGPLPSPERRRVHAPALRVLTFLRALHAAGHRLAFAEIPFGGGDEPEPEPSPVAMPLLEHRAITGSREQLAAHLSSMCGRAAFDAIVACTDIGAWAAAHCGYAGPLYVDYFGHPMAERQQQAFALGSDGGIAGMWKMVLPVLLRADRFSACSRAQRHALIGELGAAGRLSRATCGHDLVDVIPMSIGIDGEADPPARRYLAELGIPAGAPVILSTGGFNTWMDERTLFLGLERVLQGDSAVHFVATGGEIPGHVNEVFRRFRADVEASSIAKRVVLAGWVPHEQFLGIAGEALVGVNVDRPSLEGELGCRNRVLGWLWMGLRVVSTALDDMNRELVAAGLVEEFRPEDVRGLSSALQRVIETQKRRTPGELRELRRWLQERYGFEAAAAPLVRWARTPAPAPDRTTGEVATDLAQWQRAFLSGKPPEPPAEMADRAAAGEELAARLRGSRLFGMTLGKRPEIDALLERLRGR